LTRKRLNWRFSSEDAVVFVGFSIFALLNRELYFSQYPLKYDVRSYDIYTQMFDAFKKGQLNLDVDLT
jgi:hypothetical protein